MRLRGMVLAVALLAAPPAFAQSSDSVRAMLAPVNEAVLAGELAARIDALPFQNGERFKKGDTLVSFDCAAFRAALAEARASLKAADQSVANVRELARLKSAGQLELQLAESELEKQRAHVDSARVPVDRCIIRAPFSGRVVERRAQPHESVPPGQPLLAILDDSQIEVRMVAPSGWLKWLKPGVSFGLKVDETGLTYNGKVTRLGARIDAVSQSVSVVGLLDKRSEGVIAGMSGSATFVPPAQ
ncbi:MAG: efflux RND transporter periplasmic adaptor subunit [Rhodospirillaceae bacterium]|nr:efflux RND transporter periplasmic adaptor subunit [Rhodospirillales bacterium]